MPGNNSDVWSAMNYTPPKGGCNHKQSLVSFTCSCLRFMLHPVKAFSSFDCDGCGHHASFHALENPAEEAILKKWIEQDAKADELNRSAKRRKTIKDRVDTS